MESNFEKNVFINCPFDKEYKLLLHPLFFTVFSCGLTPRIATERMDSSEMRIEKIREIIEDSKYSIHDLSRIKSKQKKEYYRLNMPFEIGLDFGCKLYNPDPKYRNKGFLILEPEQFSTQKALSDLSGFDVKCHNNEPEMLIGEVRTWFAEMGFHDLPGPDAIWINYNQFNTDLFNDFSKKGFKPVQITNLPTLEFFRYLKEWNGWV
jgi:hypothetical protein